MTTTSHNHPPRPLTLTRAIGIDTAMVAAGVTAAALTFLTGQGADRWQNLVFPPLVMVFAAITLRLVLAEVRALLPVLPDYPRKGEAFTALGVAIAMTVIVAPMLLIMPFIWFAAL